MRRNYRLVRGTDLTPSETFIARDRGGTVIDLTGATIVWRIGPRGRFTTSVTKTIGDGVTVVVAADGSYTLSLLAADTDTLTPGRYRHAIEVTKAGAITLVQEGTISLERDLP